MFPALSNTSLKSNASLDIPTASVNGRSTQNAVSVHLKTIHNNALHSNAGRQGGMRTAGDVPAETGRRGADGASSAFSGKVFFDAPVQPAAATEPAPEAGHGTLLKIISRVAEQAVSRALGAVLEGDGLEGAENILSLFPDLRRIYKQADTSPAVKIQALSRALDGLSEASKRQHRQHLADIRSWLKLASEALILLDAGRKGEMTLQGARDVVNQVAGVLDTALAARIMPAEDIARINATLTLCAQLLTDLSGLGALPEQVSYAHYLTLPSAALLLQKLLPEGFSWVLDVLEEVGLIAKSLRLLHLSAPDPSSRTQAEWLLKLVSDSRLGEVLAANLAPGLEPVFAALAHAVKAFPASESSLAKLRWVGGMLADAESKTLLEQILPSSAMAPLAGCLTLIEQAGRVLASVDTYPEQASLPTRMGWGIELLTQEDSRALLELLLPATLSAALTAPFELVRHAAAYPADAALTAQLEWIAELLKHERHRPLLDAFMPEGSLDYVEQTLRWGLLPVRAVAAYQGLPGETSWQALAREALTILQQEISRRPELLLRSLRAASGAPPLWVGLTALMMYLDMPANLTRTRAVEWGIKRFYAEFVAGALGNWEYLTYLRWVKPVLEKGYELWRDWPRRGAPEHALTKLTEFVKKELALAPSTQRLLDLLPLIPVMLEARQHDAQQSETASWEQRIDSLAEFLSQSDSPALLDAASQLKAHVVERVVGAAKHLPGIFAGGPLLVAAAPAGARRNNIGAGVPRAEDLQGMELDPGQPQPSAAVSGAPAGQGKGSLSIPPLASFAGGTAAALACAALVWKIRKDASAPGPAATAAAGGDGYEEIQLDDLSEGVHSEENMAAGAEEQASLRALPGGRGGASSNNKKYLAMGAAAFLGLFAAGAFAKGIYDLSPETADEALNDEIDDNDLLDLTEIPELQALLQEQAGWPGTSTVTGVRHKRSAGAGTDDSVKPIDNPLKLPQELTPEQASQKILDYDAYTPNVGRGLARIVSRALASGSVKKANGAIMTSHLLLELDSFFDQIIVRNKRRTGKKATEMLSGVLLAKERVNDLMVNNKSPLIRRYLEIKQAYGTALMADEFIRRHVESFNLNAIDENAYAEELAACYGSAPKTAANDAGQGEGDTRKAYRMGIERADREFVGKCMSLFLQNMSAQDAEQRLVDLYKEERGKIGAELMQRNKRQAANGAAVELKMKIDELKAAKYHAAASFDFFLKYIEIVARLNRDFKPIKYIGFRAVLEAQKEGARITLEKYALESERLSGSELLEAYAQLRNKSDEIKSYLQVATSYVYALITANTIHGSSFLPQDLKTDLWRQNAFMPWRMILNFEEAQRSQHYLNRLTAAEPEGFVGISDFKGSNSFRSWASYFEQFSDHANKYIDFESERYSILALLHADLDWYEMATPPRRAYLFELAVANRNGAAVGYNSINLSWGTVSGNLQPVPGLIGFIELENKDWLVATAIDGQPAAKRFARKEVSGNSVLSHIANREKCDMRAVNRDYTGGHTHRSLMGSTLARDLLTPLWGENDDNPLMRRKCYPVLVKLSGEEGSLNVAGESVLTAVDEVMERNLVRVSSSLKKSLEENTMWHVFAGHFIPFYNIGFRSHYDHEYSPDSAEIILNLAALAAVLLPLGIKLMRLSGAQQSALRTHMLQRMGQGLHGKNLVKAVIGDMAADATFSGMPMLKAVGSALYDLIEPFPLKGLLKPFMGKIGKGLVSVIDDTVTLSEQKTIRMRRPPASRVRVEVNPIPFSEQKFFVGGMAGDGINITIDFHAGISEQILDKTVEIARNAVKDVTLANKLIDHGVCWNFVINVQRRAKLLSKADADELLLSTMSDNFGEYLGDHPFAIANMQAMASVRRGSRIAFLEQDASGIRMKHAMISAGGGKAVGMKNDWLDPAYGPGAKEIDLADMDWRGDGIYKDGRKIVVKAQASDSPITYRSPETAATRKFDVIDHKQLTAPDVLV